MDAQQVIALASLKRSRQSMLLRRSHDPVMFTGLLEECPCVPAFHSGGAHRGYINPPGFDGHESANFLKALPSKQLARPGNMLNAGEAVIVLKRPFSERCSRYTQAGASSKLSQEEI